MKETLRFTLLVLSSTQAKLRIGQYFEVKSSSGRPLTNMAQTSNAGCIFSPFIDKYRLLLCSVLEVNVRFLLQLNYILHLRVSLLPPWKRHTCSPKRGTDLITYAD